MSWDGTLIGDGVEGGEERFKLLLDTLPHGAFAIFAGGKAEYFNQAFTDYVGGHPGLDYASRTNLLHPDDRPVLEAARSAATPTDKAYVVEIRLRRHDGVYRWHQLANTPLMRAGRRVGYIGTAVDIHDIRTANEILEQRVQERTAELEQSNQRLMESEARYRMLYNRTPMALHSVSHDARLLDVNDTWTEMFGVPREHAIGRSPPEFMTPESAAVYRERAWPAMLASAGQVLVQVYQFVRGDGRVFDGRLSARGDFDAAGNFVRSWSAIADITSEIRAERELRQAQRMEAVGQLTAGIAHDFNNLMTAVLGSLELLLRRRERLDERAVRLIDGARSAAQRGAALTGQLLAFSRQQHIHAAPVDMNRTLESLLPLLRSTIGATIAIEYRLDPALSHALADPTQLELALLNLAINARDAMPGGGVMTITSANVTRGPPSRPEEPEPGEYVCLSVADSGAGIPDEVRGRIFEPFFTTKEIGKGSGLGLSQVLGVVKQLGGGVAIHSRPGQGTTVSLFLPRTTRPAVPAVAAADPAGPATPRKLNVMVVDDDPAVRHISSEMLRAAGHHVVELDSAAAALDRLAQGRPDVLVADIAMPGMNGVDLAVSIHRTWPDLPVLFMTGYAEEGLLPPESNDRVIRKPFGAADFESRVVQAAG